MNNSSYFTDNRQFKSRDLFVSPSMFRARKIFHANHGRPTARTAVHSLLDVKMLTKYIFLLTTSNWIKTTALEVEKYTVKKGFRLNLEKQHERGKSSVIVLQLWRFSMARNIVTLRIFRSELLRKVTATQPRYSG